MARTSLDERETVQSICIVKHSCVNCILVKLSLYMQDDDRFYDNILMIIISLK